VVVFVNTYRQGISHVGIYVGDGQFIHAPYAGTRVRVEPLANPYYRDRLYAAARA
jgi:cell wall-associated NlpC family hydrolase